MDIDDLFLFFLMHNCCEDKHERSRSSSYWYEEEDKKPSLPDHKTNINSHESFEPEDWLIRAIIWTTIGGLSWYFLMPYLLNFLSLLKPFSEIIIALSGLALLAIAAR
jgi:hypothetical protein